MLTGTTIRTRWLLAACILCLMAGMLAACGITRTATSDEETKSLIEQAAKAELDRFGSLSQEDLARLSQGMSQADDANVQSLAEWGIDPTELLAHVMKSYTYQITDVVLTNNGGVVKAQVSIVDLAHALEVAQDVTTDDEDIAAFGEAYRSDDNRAMAQLLHKRILTALDSEQERVTIPVDVAVQNVDGMLVADDTCLANLAGQLLQSW
ncbi:MAG: hypothetical protein Q4A01_00015 [Coriobacteriales bacterium]|nr:hypothetical protein [Coriobacteriales bacterium]